MDIHKIEVLLKAIELGSFSKAAEKYLYTPSALTHIVNSIEEELGTQLIIRTHTGISVCDDKQHIIDCLKQIVDIKNRIVSSSGINSRETVVVAAYSSLSKYVLPRIIKGIKKKYSSVDIDIVVADRLPAVNADIYIGEQFKKDGIVWDALMTDEYVAVIPESFNIDSECVSPEELFCDNTFILVYDGKIAKYIKDFNVCDVMHINSHDDSSAIQLVEEGMGVSILPELSVVNAERVRRIALTPALTRELGIMYDKDNYKRKKTVRNIVEYIKENGINRKED